jgi:hypothetical protein
MLKKNFHFSVQFIYFLTLKINFSNNKICNKQYAKTGSENQLVSCLRTGNLKAR